MVIEFESDPMTSKDERQMTPMQAFRPFRHYHSREEFIRKHSIGH